MISWKINPVPITNFISLCGLVPFPFFLQINRFLEILLDGELNKDNRFGLLVFT